MTQLRALLIVGGLATLGICLGVFGSGVLDVLAGLLLLPGPLLLLAPAVRRRMERDP